MAQETKVMTFYMELRSGPARNCITTASDSPGRGKLNAAQCDAVVQSPCQLLASPLIPRSCMQRRSLPPDTRIDFLGLPGGDISSLVRTQSQTNPFWERTPSTPGRSTAPTSPVGTRTHSFCPFTLERTTKKAAINAQGRSSVVTFSYIEKVKVKTIVNPLTSSVVPQEARPFSTAQFSSAGHQSPLPTHKVLSGFITKLPPMGSIDTVTLGTSGRPSDGMGSNQGLVHFVGHESPTCPDAQDSCISFQNGNKMDHVLTSKPTMTRNLDLGTNPMTASIFNETCSNNSFVFSHSSELLIGRESPNSRGYKQTYSCTWVREHSERAQKIAKARREFFYGTSEPQASEVQAESGIQQLLATSHTIENDKALQKEQATFGPSEAWNPLGHSLVEQHNGSKGSPLPNGNSMDCKPGDEPRTTRYSETDLDAVPVRCYQETNLDEVMAEFNVVSPDKCQSLHHPCSMGEGEAQVDEPSSPGLSMSNGSPGRGEEGSEGGEDEVFHESSSVDRSPVSEDKNVLSPAASIGIARSLSEDGTDSFSKQFECILESHTAKGTSYTSLDSVEILSSPNGSLGNYFTFDFPTLTSEIQEQIKENAHLIEEKFSPWVNVNSSVGSNVPGSPRTHVLRVDRKLSTNPMGYSKSENLLTKCQLDTDNKLLKGVLVMDADETKSNYSSSDSNLNHLVIDSESEMDSTEQLALGSTDTLANGNRTEQEAARRLAKRLYYLDGFKRSDVARHLGKNNDFSKMVAEEYLRFFDFTGLSLDQALRAFLKEFALMGETQERERVLIHFSHRYHQCNPDTISAEDGIHTLTCALMLLNTDLHGHNIGKRMSCSDFISNLEGLNDGQDFPKDLLKLCLNAEEVARGRGGDRDYRRGL